MHENKAIQVAAALAVTHLQCATMYATAICFEIASASPGAPYQATEASGRAMRRELHPLGVHFIPATPSPKRVRKTAADRRLEAVCSTAKQLGIYRGR
jgi:hypothetical protein